MNHMGKNMARLVAHSRRTTSLWMRQQAAPLTQPRHLHPGTTLRHLSASISAMNVREEHPHEPQGDLWEVAHNEKHTPPTPSSDWLGREARIRRTFGAQAADDAMLLCGGPALAAHASFDPHYARAQDWIHTHAVGPAVLSPILASGLLQTLAQAALPHAVPLSHSFQQVRPLIVGVPVDATIRVTRVERASRQHPQHHEDDGSGYGNDTNSTLSTSSSQIQQQQQTLSQHGYQVELQAVVARARDHAVLSQGHIALWLADLQPQCPTTNS